MNTAKRMAMSQLEVVMSTMFVSVVIVASMQSFAITAQQRSGLTDKSRATHLANQLLSEIQTAKYMEGILEDVIGRNSDELLATKRETFDDVDDYHLWSESPPEDRSGSVIPGYTGWQRSVSVKFANADKPWEEKNKNEGLKTITVTIEKNNVVILEIVGLKADDNEE